MNSQRAKHTFQSPGSLVLQGKLQESIQLGSFQQF